MSHYNFKKVTTVPTAKVSDLKDYLSNMKSNVTNTNLSLIMVQIGVYRHYTVENPAKNANRHSQTLQDRSHSFVLHAKGQVRPAELPRSIDAHSRRVSETR